MAYIRKRDEELTGLQCHGGYDARIDVSCDFIMSYGIGDDFVQCVDSWREAGYAVNCMTGIAWGHYCDYLDGEFDGRQHWDEAQTDRFGNQVLHSPRVPYMVPTVDFAEFITARLKKAVDAGVGAIFVEEPEFFDRGGYSEAFKREYKICYGTEWTAPHESIDGRYKAAKLKAYLYKRTIDRVSAAIKTYALTKYNRNVRFYVPTHSLLNYVQWKIVSPEASLTEVPGVDGYIAQIWTGTSREPNVYEGKIAERTFETAYLEYGVMQELVSGTGRQMWFLHDPIEDQPCYDWDDYRTNYYKTVTASLLHPQINTFEVCPWPNRVLDGEHKYPSGSPDAMPIPSEYRTLLNGNFQMLGDIPKAKSSAEFSVGMLISDTALYQRDYPDGVINAEAESRVGTVLRDTENDDRDYENILFKGNGDLDLRLRFEKSGKLPVFYGLTLPLLKQGVPVRPVLLDNARRFVGYLDNYDVLVLSYEYCKPEFPDTNATLAAWVREGGTLIYVGDGKDPYHKINSFWTGKYENPAQHLFDLLGIKEPANVEYSVNEVGNGRVCVWNYAPSEICHSKKNADEWRDLFDSVVTAAGFKWLRRNYLLEKRGAYTVAAVFDESFDDTLTLNGVYADMYSVDFKTVENPVLKPGENHVYFDYGEIADEKLRVIGTSARVNALTENDGVIELALHSPEMTEVYTRLRLPYEVALSKDDADLKLTWDALTNTALIKGGRYGTQGTDRTVKLIKK